MAKIVAYPWTFVQTGPPSKTLTLDGPNAPYGRPRKGAVVEDELEIRAGKTFYPGNPVPDRHVFGPEQTPFTLTGRFMDSRIGVAGGAQAKWDEMRDFVADTVIVRGAWGGIWAGTGLLTKCKRGIESAEEFTWALTLEPDTDDTKTVKAPIAPPANTSALIDLVNSLKTKALERIVNIPPDISYQPGFLDKLKTLISTINSGSATVANFADSVDNYESALSSDVAHFRAGISQYATAIEQLQITTSSAVNDPAVVAARQQSQAIWYAIQSQNDCDLLEILADLATADLAAEIVQKGQPDVTTIATGGDTWESLAVVLMGSAARADVLKQANGVRYGAAPTPGQIIHIPKAQ